MLYIVGQDKQPLDTALGQGEHLLDMLQGRFYIFPAPVFEAFPNLQHQNITSMTPVF